jgi:hypothetical protein
MPDNEQYVVPPKISPPKDQLAPDKLVVIEAGSSTAGIPQGEIGQYPLTATVRAMQEYGIKGFSAMALLCSHTERIETDLVEARRKNEELREDLNTIREKYYAAKEQLAVLSERLASTGKMHTLQNVLLTLGGVSLGTGVRMMLDTFTGTSIAVALLGAVLLLFGWFWSPQAKEAKS